MAKKLVGELVDKGNGRYLLKNVRLSYPYLFEPDEQEGDDGKMKKSYRASLLLPKDTHKKVAQQINRLISELCEEEYGNPKISSDRKFLRDGDEAESEDHHGCWVISIRETRRPTLVDRERSPTVEEDELLYAGAWVNVVIRPWAQNGKSMKKKNKYGKRINCGFDIVQFVTHDDNLAGNTRPDVDDVLDELDDDFEDGIDTDTDEDEDERPSRSSKSKKSKAKRRSRDEDDDDDDDDEDEDDIGL